MIARAAAIAALLLVLLASTLDSRAEAQRAPIDATARENVQIAQLGERFRLVVTVTHPPDLLVSVEPPARSATLQLVEVVPAARTPGAPTMTTRFEYVLAAFALGDVTLPAQRVSWLNALSHLMKAGLAHDDAPVLRQGSAQIAETEMGKAEAEPRFGRARSGAVARRLDEQVTCPRVVADLEVGTSQVDGDVGDIILQVALLQDGERAIERLLGIRVPAVVAVMGANDLQAERLEVLVAELLHDCQRVLHVAKACRGVRAVLDQQRRLVGAQGHGRAVIVALGGADGRRERKDRRTQKKPLLSRIFSKDRRGFSVLREAEVLDIYVPPLKGEKDRRTVPTRRNTPR